MTWSSLAARSEAGAVLAIHGCVVPETKELSTGADWVRSAKWEAAAGVSFWGTNTRKPVTEGLVPDSKSTGAGGKGKFRKSRAGEGCGMGPVSSFPVPCQAALLYHFKLQWHPKATKGARLSSWIRLLTGPLADPMSNTIKVRVSYKKCGLGSQGRTFLIAAGHSKTKGRELQATVQWVQSQARSLIMARDVLWQVSRTMLAVKLNKALCKTDHEGKTTLHVSSQTSNKTGRIFQGQRPQQVHEQSKDCIFSAQSQEKEWLSAWPLAHVLVSLWCIHLTQNFKNQDGTG